MLNQRYEQYCANRLPCGICRLTNSQCPKAGITVNWSTVTCTASNKTTPFTETTGTTADTKSTYTGTTTEAHLS